MSFYSDFAEYYEEVFPYRPVVHDFLASYLPPGRQRILDIGCGTGHYCGRLAAAGHDVVGVDLDLQMIAAASTAYTQARFRCLDMIDVDTLEPPFDMVFCIGNVAAHLPRKRIGEFLEKLARRLRPGGWWIFQVVNWDRILPHASYDFPDRTVGKEGVVFQREYRDISPEGLRFRTRLAAPDRTIFTGEVELYPVPAEEYLELHRRAGFTFVGHYGDYQLAHFDPETSGAGIYVFQR